MSNLMTAHAQYVRRTRDETFPDVPALIAHARAEKNLTAERTYNLKDLHVEATDTPTGPSVVLASPKGTAEMSHWAFGQLARTVGAPAGYLRTLPPANVAADLNYGLQASPVGTTANLLVRGTNGHPPLIRACTSETYGRLFDADLYDAAQQQVFAYSSVRGTPWQTPMSWDQTPAGVYRGDRDSFVIQIDGGSIVTDPSARFSGGTDRKGDGQLYRGILIRNSETGACSVTIECVLFRYICGNLIIWGATIARAFRRRHVGKSVLRDVVRELGKIARQWTQRPASEDERLIRLLIDRELATTKDAVIDELRAMGATLEQARNAYDTCERTEAVSPRSFWGLAQGLTRDSQRAEYRDERHELDALAGIVLARGAKLVAA